ncbi:MAG: ParB/RepB/Spo0J family partition protein [Mollicutes bacterium]|nr:ParB/RepB/Spo0J family partition protein [Mollicutes bacterium]
MENEKKVVELDLDDILPNRFQPRIKFDEGKINELAESIKEHGVIQPIIVRPIGDKYEIIAGERRYKASVIAGKSTIPAIITDLNDRESAEIALIENVQREDLSPIEEAISYRKILNMGLTQEQLADKLDRNQSTISNKLRLLNLEEDVQEALLNNKISERHARSLLRLHDPKQQVAMLERIINERLTVRRTDEDIDKLLNADNNNEKNILMQNIEEKGETMDNKENIDFNIPSEPIINDADEQPIDFIDVNNPIKPELLLDFEEQEPVVENFNINNETRFIDNAEKPGFLDIDKIETEAQDIHIDKPIPNIDDLLQLNSTSTPIESIDEESDKEQEKQPIEDNIDNIWTNKFFDIENNAPENTAVPQEPEETDNIFSGDTFVDISPDNIIPTDENVNIDEDLNKEIEFDNNSFPEINNIYNNEDNIDMPDIFNAYETDNEDIDNLGMNLDNVITNDNIEEIKKENEILFQNNVEAGADLKSIISTIRNCASEIEKMGYVIETEELDFENEYRVTFKINKEKSKF